MCRRLAGPKRCPSVETANFRSGRMSLPSVYQLMYTRPFASRPTAPPRWGQALIFQWSALTSLASPKVRPPSRETARTMSRMSPGKTRRQVSAPCRRRRWPRPRGSTRRYRPRPCGCPPRACPARRRARPTWRDPWPLVPVDPGEHDGAVGREREAVERVRDRPVLVHAQRALEGPPAVERPGELQIGGEERALGLRLSGRPGDVDLPAPTASRGG